MQQLPFVKGYAEQFYLRAEEGLQQAIEDQADYWYIDGSFPEEYPKHWNTSRLENLHSQCQKNNITPLFHGNFKLPLATDIEDLRELAVKTVCQEVDIASVLKAPLIIHGGVIVEPRLVIKAKQAALENYLRSIEKIIDYATKKNVTILLENLSNYKNYRPFHYIFTTPEEYDFVLKRIAAENVFLFFDVGHGTICEGEPAEVIKQFYPYIWGMSLSNNDGIRDQHLQLDHGILDFNNIVKAIVETDWQGVIAFEVRGRSLAKCIQDLTTIYTNLYESSIAQQINNYPSQHETII